MTLPIFSEGTPGCSAANASATIGSECTAAGSSSQPASSKNHPRRSSLTNRAWFAEKASIGNTSSPAKALPEYCPAATCSLLNWLKIPTRDERSGTCILAQRNVPASSRPKIKSAGLLERIGFSERSRMIESECGRLEIDEIAPSAPVVSHLLSLSKRSGRAA